MKSAPVQNSSSVATVYPDTSGLRSSSRSLFNNAVAVYPQLGEGPHSYSSRSLTIILVTCFFFSSFYGQVNTASKGSSAQPGDTTTKEEIVEMLKNLPHPGFLDSQTKPNKNRRLLIGGLNVVGYGTSIVIFNNQWYKNYPKTSFHTFNDSKEWLQMDKIGHSWAAYNSGRASTAMWKWAGLSDKKATWIGGLSSTAYLTVIEILDAHSAKWGWSWADMGANIFGSGLFISQELGWQEQRIQFKFSFHRKKYSDPMLNARSDELFGSTWAERMLKDYNGQSYWLSANLKSFFPNSNLPAWLNVAVGYGADGMFGGFENKWTDGDPGFPIDRTDIKRFRQWYLAPDIDFTKINTNKKVVKVLLDFLNAFKFPAPSLELSNGQLKVNAIHF